MSGVGLFEKTSLDVAQCMLHTIETGYRVRGKRALLNSLLGGVVNVLANFSWIIVVCIHVADRMFVNGSKVKRISCGADE